MIAERLDAEGLQALVAGRVRVVRHRAWYPPEACTELAPRLLEVLAALPPGGEDGVRSLGPVIGYALRSGAEAARYFEQAKDGRHLLRELFAPRPSPLDRLRVELDELWPGGASLGRVGGAACAGGTLRYFPPGSLMNPHVDHVGGPILLELCGQARLAANVYLAVPGAGGGGALRLWTRPFSDEELAPLRRPDFGLDPDKLGPPDLSLEPSPGDLVLFDTAYVHAVSPVSAPRVTASCFIGARSAGSPLSLFA